MVASLVDMVFMAWVFIGWGLHSNVSIWITLHKWFGWWGDGGSDDNRAGSAGRGFRKATVKALFDEVGKERAVDHYSGNKEHGFNDVCITLIPLCVAAAPLDITFDFLEDVFAGSLIGSGVHLFVD